MGTNDDLDDDAEIFGVGTKKPSSVLKVPEVPTHPKLEQAAVYNEKMKSAFATIIKMFNTAKAANVEYPKFRAEGLILSPAPAHGRNPGSVYVKRIVEGGEDIYLGVIVPPGEFMPKPACTMGDNAALVRITEHPFETAVAYGQKTAHCAICNRKLRNAVSVARGIGPICAGNFGIGSFTAEEIKADKDEVEVKGNVPNTTEGMLTELATRTGGIPQFAQTALAQAGVSTTAIMNADAIGRGEKPEQGSLNATAEINGLDVTKAELIGKFVSVIVDGNHNVDEKLVKMLGKFADAIINTNK